MAGVLLHVTLAREALGRARIGKALRRDIEGCAGWFDLGAVLLDLPFFERIWLMGLRLAMGLEVRYGAWGTLIHMRSPAGLVFALLERADEPWSRGMGLGVATHLAVDVVFHPEIQRRVLDAADGRAGLDSLHKKIEDQMDLHVFFDRLGHSGIGTPYARRVLAGLPGPGRPWALLAREAVNQIHGVAPPASRFESWRRGLATFGLAMSFPSPLATTLPDDDPDLAASALGLADRAVNAAAEHIEVAAAVVEGRLGGQEFLRAIPDRSLVDGGPALLRRLEFFPIDG